MALAFYLGVGMSRINDSTWVRRVFGLGRIARDRRNNSVPRTSADFKFADTSFGGNVAVNTSYQSCRFADIKATGLLADPDLRSPTKQTSAFENENNSGSFRMGRRFSEIHDDNAQYVHFRFGVPKYTGSLGFFFNMYDRDAARLAKTGEYSSIMRDLGGVVGLGAMFVLFPLAVMVPLFIGAQTFKFLLGSKPSSYYFLKPTMNLYLQAVQAMADTQLLHHRLVPMWEPLSGESPVDLNPFDDESKKQNDGGRYTEVGDSKNKLTAPLQEVYSLLPDIWKSNGKFDVFKATQRHQVLANYQARTMERIYADAADEKEMETKLELYVKNAKHTAIMHEQIKDDKMSLQKLAEVYADNPLYHLDEKEERERRKAVKEIEKRLGSAGGVNAQDIINEQESAELIKKISPAQQQEQTNGDFWNGLTDFYDNALEQFGSEIMDGSQWISFKVGAKGSVSDSFSNGTKEPEIASTLNSLSSKARSLDVSLSGGKVGIDVIDSITTGVKDFLGGALDTINLSGLTAVYNAAFVDIPDVLDSSSASLASESFTLQLRTPYGNDFSLFQDIAMPLNYILAGVLPMATGKQTHGHPFICEVISRGRTVVRLGVIDSVSITRGVGNMGWRTDGKALAVDVTVNVKDLSKIVAMPIIKDPSIFDDHNKYSDYMATLGGASLHNLTYDMERLVFNLNKWRQSWKSAFSSGRIANEVGNSIPGRMISVFTKGVAR